MLSEADPRRLEGKRVRRHGVVIDGVSHFGIPRVASARGIHVRLSYGGVRERMTLAQLRFGYVAGVVAFLRPVAGLARALERRIRDVLAGRIRRGASSSGTTRKSTARAIANRAPG